jgi:uncharacterized membrane protein YobD (UPF0266 family)
VFDQYANLGQTGCCNYPYDTQTNESSNQAIATTAPKTTGTISLYSRAALVIGIHNLGYVEQFMILFQKLGMYMTLIFMQYLEEKEEKEENEAILSAQT